MPQLIDAGLFSLVSTSSALGVGYTLTFYVVNTTTLTNTYPTEADATAGTNPNANPLTIGYDGRLPPIWVTAQVKCVLKDAVGVVQETLNPINDYRAPLASEITAATGGTVEDAIWHVGRAAPIAGSKMAIRWLRDSVTYPLEDDGGIWSGPVVTDHGISATFGAADGGANAPCAALFVLSNNNGSGGDVCGAVFDTIARTDNTAIFGANIVARCDGRSGVKYVGLEIDVEPGAGASSVSNQSGGIFLNAFSVAIPGPAIMTGGVSSGTFNNGLILGGLSSSAAGVALASGGQADSLVNSTVGTFNGTAVSMGTSASRGLLWSGGGKSTRIYFDGTNQREVLPASGAWVWRDPTDTTSIAVIDSSGNLDLQAGGLFKISSTQVVGARVTGWGAASNGSKAAFNGATATLGQTSAALAQVISDLTAHGLIGS